MLSLILNGYSILADAAATKPTTFPANKDDAFIDALHGQKLDYHDFLGTNFWTETIQDGIHWLLTLIPEVIVGLIIFFVFYAMYRVARRLAGGTIRRAHVETALGDLLLALIRWSILGFGLVMALNQVGIQVAPLLAGVSVIGLAVGFAAQETLANFIAGVVILWDRPFRVGDWVTIDDQYGRVQRISFRSTRLLNDDGDTVVVPNTAILSTKLANHSTHVINRVNVPVVLPAHFSIDKARSILLPLTQKDSRIHADPAPEVVVDSVAGDVTNLLLRFWIEDESKQRAIYHEYLEKGKKAIDGA